MKTLLALPITFFIAVQILFAQDDLRVERQVGPSAYPPAARAVRARGEVMVEVTVDLNGHVMAVKAITGHPLLKAASETAARSWEFSVSEQKVNARKANLFFSYVLGDWIHVPSSEKRSETVLRHDFTSEYSVSSYYETLIPRLLLLPRADGVVKRKECHVHGIEMMVETLLTICPRKQQHDNEDIVETDQLQAATRSLFPNAVLSVFNECNEIDIEQMEVYFCSACRVARDEWLRQRRN